MYKAEIITDSITEADAHLTTMQVTFPRFILAEFNTHRQFSRNSASSRAIPIAKRIAEVRENPFVPEVFTKNKKGMQGGDPLDDVRAALARDAWLSAASRACLAAEQLAEAGVHKQYANRVLEPYLWHTVVVSSTEWSNFFEQRCHPDAQPEIREIAERMRAALSESQPRLRHYHQCHLPYILPEEESSDLSLTQLQQISVARCARVSYRTFMDGGKAGPVDVAADLALCASLAEKGHWSPFEHVATPALVPGFQSGNFTGWFQFRKVFPNECR